MDINNYVIQLSRKQRTADGRYETKVTNYLPVQGRMVWFREENKENTKTRIIDKIIDRDAKFAYFEIEVTDSHGNVEVGVGQEVASDFADYIEKAYTKAYGRALAALGYGTQFAAEFDEGDVVDAPKETREVKPAAPKPAPKPAHEGAITQEQSKQLKEIITKYKLSKEQVASVSVGLFGKQSSIDLTEAEAAILIDVLLLQHDTGDPAVTEQRIAALMQKLDALKLTDEQEAEMIQKLNTLILE